MDPTDAVRSAKRRAVPAHVHKGFAGNTGYALICAQNGTANEAFLRVELEGLTIAGVTGVTLLLPGDIHHVAATWDGSVIRVYVDGQIDGVGAATGAIPATTDPLEIGRRPDGIRYWEGVLDEVAIYATALTPTQIASHYAAGTL